MIPLALGFLTAATIVSWFFRGGTKRPADQTRSERGSSTNGEVADETSATTLEVESLPDCAPSEQVEAPAAEEAHGAPGQEQPASLEEAGASAVSRQKPDVLAHQEAETRVHNGVSGALLTIVEPATQNGRLPLANLEEILFLPAGPPLREHEELPVGDGISVMNEQAPSCCEPMVSEAPAITQARDDLSAEGAPSGPEEIPSVAQPLADELPQANYDVEQTHRAEQRESVAEDSARAPSRYRPPPQKPPRQGVARSATHETECRVPSEVSLEIRVRLTFDRFGFCAIGLLPGRTSDLDAEVAVRSGALSLELVAQEEWYQDLQFDNIGGYLRQGLELKGRLADRRHARWLLTGRDVYVLASHQRASGFVSASRLALGRSHVVLCVVELRQEVKAILDEAGCRGYITLDESHGVPAGWVGFRGVSPTQAIPLASGSDPFYAIKPAPDLEIELEGGVCLRNSVWLAGYPPRIRLLGQDGGVKVLIDGEQAFYTADGGLAVDGYGRPGPHSVYCEGLSCSRSYSIEEPPDYWEVWPAYRFDQADICGPSVQLTTEAEGRRVFSVPMANPLLLGAEPGQIFRCSSRRVAQWKGFVPFEVVWALPAVPLLCDKKTARILQFANAGVAPHKIPIRGGLAWSHAILDAARKGLRVENGSPDSAVRWNDYKKAAWNIRRAAR